MKACLSVVIQASSVEVSACLVVRLRKDARDEENGAGANQARDHLPPGEVVYKFLLSGDVM